MFLKKEKTKQNKGETVWSKHNCEVQYWEINEKNN